jgi:lipopolysaccharide transport system permease protein
MAGQAIAIDADPIAPGGDTRIHRAARKLALSGGKVWRHGTLVRLFVWRDIKVRYKQTVLGVAWAFLQPLLATFAFTLVFTKIAKVSSNGLPYPVFVLAGLLPWQFFAQGMIRAGNSLAQERYLLTRLPIPKIVLPIAAILSGLPDFGVGLSLLIGLFVFYGMAPGWNVVAILPIGLLVFAGTAAMGILLAAINVRFRDVSLAIPFLTQIWFFLTPVGYPSTLVAERWRFLFQLNPLSGIVELFRWAAAGGPAVPWRAGAFSVASVAALLVVSLIYFKRMQANCADAL